MCALIPVGVSPFVRDAGKHIGLQGLARLMERTEELQGTAGQPDTKRAMPLGVPWGPARR